MKTRQDEIDHRILEDKERRLGLGGWDDEVSDYPEEQEEPGDDPEREDPEATD
jgi:hypothetical protein